MRVERRPADESAVDVRLREICREIIRLHAAAVENRHVAQSAVTSANPGHDAVRLGSVAVLARADRPNGFVGENQTRDLVLVQSVERGARLRDDAVARAPVLALAERLSDGHDRMQSLRERGLDFAIDRLVRLAEVLATLGVSEDHVRDAEIEQHRRGDLSGERPGQVPMHVLRAERHAAGPRERGRDRGQGRKRRRDDDVDAAVGAG